MKKIFTTLEEIQQQPLMWKKTLEIMSGKTKAIHSFIRTLGAKYNQVHVVFIGAGTSHYVGDILVPYLKSRSTGFFTYESIPTTDIVSNPDETIEDRPTVLVSFARSGNAPESIAAIELYERKVKNLHQIVVTCAEDGKLAQKAKKEEETLLVLLDPRTNDKGSVMTGSFTSMTLAALMLFDNEKRPTKTAWIKKLIQLGELVNEKEKEIRQLAQEDFSRIVYLGSGSLGRLAEEARQKMLEMTAGEIVACHESSMGFRYGCKFFVHQETLIIPFVSNREYTGQYDLDLIRELEEDGIAKAVYPVDLERDLGGFSLPEGREMPDAYISVIYAMFAQYLAFYTGIRLGYDVDNPSYAGTVNYRAQDVAIHTYKE